MAAHTLFGGPAIVVDFGTSTNLDVVSPKGEFLGGALAPGIEISVDALASRAAQLRKVELIKPKNVIGKNTVEALQSGTIYGFAGQVEIPTILFTGVADPVTAAGNQQSVADKYAAYYAEKWEAVKKAKGYKRPANNQLVLWNFPLEKYTKYTAAGAPDTSVPAATGTNHCNFTTSQYMAIADLLAYASLTGKHLSGGPLLTKIRKAGNMTYDRGYSAPRMKYYGN